MKMHLNALPACTGNVHFSDGVMLQSIISGMIDCLVYPTMPWEKDRLPALPDNNFDILTVSVLLSWY